MGRVDEFYRSIEDCTERMDQYFVANAVEADMPKKRAVLLTCCGPSMYQLIRNLAAPDPPTAKTYDELVKLAPLHQQ